jgi:hypothetical protein
VTSGGRRDVPWGGLAWIVSLVLWLTWAPFLPRVGAATVVVVPPASVGDAVINAVLLAPAGLVLGLVADARRTRREVLATAAVLCWIVLVAEGGQFFVEGRHVSLFDGLLNVSGGLAGFFAAVRLRRAGHEPGTMLAVTGSHLFFGIVVYMAAVGSHVGGSHRLADWNPDHGIRVGGEFEAPRDYRGRVDSAEICARDDGDEVCAAGGAGESARRALARAAVRGQHVELGAAVRSSSAQQRGPTRILTFSTSEALRNATLGQSGRDLVLRLRTPLAGENGTGVEFRLPGAVPVGKTARVRAVYDGGMVTLSSRTEGGVERRSFDYRLLTVARLVAWQIEGYRPAQIAVAVVVSLLALFFPLGYGSAILVERPVAAAGAALAAAGVGFVVMTHLLALGWVWAWAGAGAATAGAGLLAGRSDRRRMARKSGRGPRDVPVLLGG